MLIKHQWYKLSFDPNTFLNVIKMKTVSKGFKPNNIWTVYSYKYLCTTHFTLSAMLIVKKKKGVYFSNNWTKRPKSKVILRFITNIQSGKYIFESFLDCFSWVRVLWSEVGGEGRKEERLLYYKLITRLFKSFLSMVFALNLFRKKRKNISVSHCLLFFLAWQVTLF